MLSHEEGIRVVTRGLILLGIITLVEVAIALVGNGHVIHGLYLPKLIMYPVMIGFSLYKAYFIVYEFMHMKYEVPGLAKSVLLPTLLLVWGIIAFFQEGGSWRQRREQIIEKNKENVAAPKPTGWNNVPEDTKSML
jgi:cytochrome c oxidase subunit IV